MRVRVIRRHTTFCVLLDRPVTYDGRVQRTVRTLSTLGQVLLVTSGGSERDQELFDNRVEVRPTVRPIPSGLRKFVLLHRQNDQLLDAVLSDDRRFDVVWANDYSTIHPAREIARKTGAKLVYESHEIWLETVNQFFPSGAALPRALAFRAIIGICRAIGARKEPKMTADADVLITANESYRAVLQKRLGRDDIAVVLNCPELGDLGVSDRIRDETGLAPSDRVVLYQGVMNAGRGLRELVLSAGQFPHEVRLVMLGHGVLESSLRRLVQESGLTDRVLMLGSVPHADLPHWTASADLGVLILDPINLSKRLSLANKIFEYMAAGIPILTTDLPENRRIIEECECGWLVRDRDPETLAQTVARILEDPAEMKRRGTNGRRWFEQRYNWERESTELLAAVRGLVPGAERVHA